MIDLTYIHFTDEQKQKAASVDLEAFLRSRGERLISSGRDKRLASDHSVTICGNEWYDHAEEKGGTAISFVQRHYGIGYAEAVTMLDSDDVHCLMIGASGVGKTAYFLYPNLEYACASGMSFFASDTKGDLEQAMASVMSTVLSRLNAFLDSELEQILCFDSSMDAESFASKKSAIFLILPEEDQTKNFMAGLMIQNLSRELFSVADEHGGKLQNRVVFFCDELGTMPAFDILPLFSAGRSRRLTLVPIIQALAQLEKNYSKEGAEIIVDNVQDTIFGGFAPNSQTAEVLSKALGSRTVLSGSVSRSKDNPSESLQMMERPLMTADELKAIPKGTFVVMKTGKHPMQVKLRLFLDWGITFDEPYQIEERASRKIAYADRDELIRSILKKYPPKESLERPRSRVRREAPAQEQAVTDKPEALHVPNKEDYS